MIKQSFEQVFGVFTGVLRGFDPQPSDWPA